MAARFLLAAAQRAARFCPLEHKTGGIDLPWQLIVKREFCAG
jgi:hypothetical protein